MVPWRRLQTEWVCQEFCVGGLVDHRAATNLSSNMMANWVFASHHSRGGIFRFPTNRHKGGVVEATLTSPARVRHCFLAFCLNQRAAQCAKVWCGNRGCTVARLAS
jgi:hypothetical protein